ncbi:MAG: cobalt-precorrin-6A reductase [Pseudomonadota bacterium]
MAEKFLVLGGTKEAAELAEQLVAQHGADAVISSLAGRTKEPKPVAGHVRIGGYGGVEGLIDYLQRESITRVIDATHPFAKQISANAKAACAKAAVPLDIRTRQPWQRQTGDHWIEVEDLNVAVDTIPSGARALLALGSQHIAIFAKRHDVHFTVRLVDAPENPLPLPQHTTILGIPPVSWRDELAILQSNKITHIICRNSGGEGAYAKIKAARYLGLPVIIVKRPVTEPA